MDGLQEAFDCGFEAVKAYVDRGFASFEVRLSTMEQRLEKHLVEPSSDIDARAVDREALRRLEETIRETDRQIEARALRAFEGLPKPVTRDEVTTFVDEAIAAIPSPKDGAPGRDGVDGKSIAIDDVAPLIAAEVEKAVAAIPVPKDGRDGLDGASGVDGAAGSPGDAGEPGRDGKDAEPVTREQIITAVRAAPDLIEEAVRIHLAANPPAPGRDGRGLAGALLDKDGQLVVTMTDGAIERLGVVVGRDGSDGSPGAIGAPGKDGRDGFTPEDFEVDAKDGGRTLVFRAVHGDIAFASEVATQVVIDRGVWKDGTTYAAGDGVTWGGSWFIAQKDTTAKPETNEDWRLAVKRGRDGKQGKDGDRGPPGPAGPPGTPGRNGSSF